MVFRMELPAVAREPRWPRLRSRQGGAARLSAVVAPGTEVVDARLDVLFENCGPWNERSPDGVHWNPPVRRLRPRKGFLDLGVEAFATKTAGVAAANRREDHMTLLFQPIDG